MPQALIDGLEVGIHRLIARTLPGERQAAGVGRGHGACPAAPVPGRRRCPSHRSGCDSARSGGQPHVRLHVPERALTTWIALDVSASMAFGTTERLKADVAEGVALAFGRLGVRHAGSVGLVSFGSGDDRVLAPAGRQARPGRAPARARAKASPPTVSATADGLARALRRVAKVARLPGLIVVISDFRHQREWEGPLGSLRLRHTIVAVEVRDPREAEMPNVGRLALVDPETGARIEVDTSRRRVRERFAELEAAAPGTGGAGAAASAHHPHLALDRRAVAGDPRTAPAMSFANPLWLLALLLVPLGLLAQRRFQRRARRYAIRFPAVATLRGRGRRDGLLAVATSRSGSC